MYLFCPWFFLVIYLAFLMLDVWADRLLCLDIGRSEAVILRAQARRHDRYSVVVGPGGSCQPWDALAITRVVRSGSGSGAVRAVPRAGSAVVVVLCGARAATAGPCTDIAEAVTIAPHASGTRPRGAPAMSAATPEVRGVPPDAASPSVMLPRIKPDLGLNDATLFAVYCFIKNFIG